jgi:DNA polymerase-1
VTSPFPFERPTTLVKPGGVPALLERLDRAPAVGLDTESSGPNLLGKNMLNVLRSTLTGVSLATEEGAFYVPIGHVIRNVGLDEVEKLFAWRPKPEVPLYIHGAKHEAKAFATGPFPWPLLEHRKIGCTQILAHLAQKGQNMGKKNVSFGLKQLVSEHLGYRMQTFEEVVGRGTFAGLDPKDPKVLRYACDDATGALAIAEFLIPFLLPGQLELFWKTRGRTFRAFAEMESTGFGLDVPCLEGHVETFERRLRELEEEWDFLIGGVSMRSSKQLQRLFEDGTWSSEGLQTTTQGFSTEREYVEKQLRVCKRGSLGYRAAVVKLEHGRLSKLVSTYGRKLVDLSRQYPDFRLHGSFNPTGTVTGRPSSSDPNLLNIPTRTEEGRRIREALTAGREGWTLLSADYSQVELRILAHLLGGGNLFSGLVAGADPHQITADNAGTDRPGGKYLNFAIIYGVGTGNIAKNLGCSVSKAKSIIDTLNRNEPGIEQLRSRIESASRKRGYVRTLAGRHQLLPDLRSSSKSLRASAERKVFNTPHQGGAADIMDAGMMAFFDAKDDDRCRLVCQVYDDLVCLVRDDYLDEARELLQTSLESAWDLRVPLVAEPADGYRWSDHK